MAPWDLIRRPVELHSPLAPDEVLARLRDELGSLPSQLWRGFNLKLLPGPRQASGWIRGRHVWLSYGRRGVSNSWRPTLHLKVEASGTGTSLRGRIGWSIWVTAFTAVFFGIGIAGVADGDWVAAGVLGFGAVLATVATSFGRRDADALFVWLAQVIEAQEPRRGLPG